MTSYTYQGREKKDITDPYFGFLIHSNPLLIYAQLILVCQRETLPHPSLKFPPSCHKAKVICDNLPHPTHQHNVHSVNAALCSPLKLLLWLPVQSGLHISCILLLFLMLTFHSLFPVYFICWLIFSSLHPCVGVLALGVFRCVCVAAVFVCDTLDAFAPSPGDGPGTVAAAPAADAFSGSGGWQNSLSCVSECEICFCFSYIKSASASTGDSGMNTPTGPTVCPPALMSQSWTLMTLMTLTRLFSC